jgi:DNA primase
MPTIPDYQVEEIRDRIDIVDLVGRYVDLRREGHAHKGLCPFHTEKTPSFKVNPARKTYKCFGCGAGGDAISFLMEIEGKGFQEAVRTLADLCGLTLSALPPDNTLLRARHRRRSESERRLQEDDRRRSGHALEIFDRCRAIEPDDPVYLYLRRRGLRPQGAFWPTCLRCGFLREPDTKKTFPAMVALVVDVCAMPVAIHRTFLTDDGRKAPVEVVKRSLGPLPGAAIRLGIDSEQIIVAEGIESALGAAMAGLDGVPWATLSSGNMPNLSLPRNVTHVTIAPDNDRNEAGWKAAVKLRAKIKQLQIAQNREIHVVIKPPPRGRKDYADFEKARSTG